jgi:hypothetical protein
MHTGQIAFYLLGGVIVLGISFLLWALFQLILETMRHGEMTPPPAEPRRWRY